MRTIVDSSPAGRTPTAAPEPSLLLEVADVCRRGLRLRCPCCGHGALFRAGFEMYERCAACDERFEREPGQWFGAIYINVILTQLITVSGFLLTSALTTLTTAQVLALWLPVAGLGPLAFHRRAKGLWTGIIFLGEGLYLAWPRR